MFRLGYINGFTIYKKIIVVWLKKNQRIQKIQNISLPANRVYFPYKKFPYITNGVLIVSTIKGIMTSLEASRYRIGGEVLFYLK